MARERNARTLSTLSDQRFLKLKLLSTSSIDPKEDSREIKSDGRDHDLLIRESVTSSGDLASIVMVVPSISSGFNNQAYSSRFSWRSLGSHVIIDEEEWHCLDI